MDEAGLPVFSRGRTSLPFQLSMAFLPGVATGVLFYIIVFKRFITHFSKAQTNVKINKT